MLCIIIWPASREKGPSDITNSVDQEWPLHDVENTYKQSVYPARNIFAIVV